MEKHFEDLTNLPGVPGNEHEVRKYLKNEYSKYTDEILQDRLGSIFAVKKSKNPDAPTVMIGGHMDEVGALVVGFTKTGLIKMQNVGGVKLSDVR